MRESRPRGGEGWPGAHRVALAGLLVLGAACSSEVPAPPLEGRALFVRERAGTVATAWIDLATGATGDLLAGAFPAAPDPLGKVALLVQSEDPPEGHRERLCTMPLPPAAGPCTALAPDAEFVRNPVWSADGAFVVYESSAASFRDLWRVAREGGEAHRLTDAPHGSFDPALSPDGSWLLFASSRDGDLELYRQPLGGGAAERLTTEAGDDRSPAFRPDGARIAYLSTRGPTTAVTTSLPDGGDASRLSPLTDGAVALSWSPDGRRLAVIVAGEGGAELLLIDAVRGLRLGSVPAIAANAPPAWTRGGDAALYAAPVEGRTLLHTVGADGVGARVLTTGAGADWLPRVSAPCP